MNREYFKNCSDEQIGLYARYDAFTMNNHFRAEGGIKHAIAYLEEKGNIGDTSLECLHEDENNAVFLSTDSSIKVVINVVKGDFSKSSSIELA